MNTSKLFLMVFMFALFSSGCSGQDNDFQQSLVNREPAVSGQFYSSDPASLKADLSVLFSNAVPKEFDNVLAVISPHAGYVFSGEVAASCFNQLDEDKHYENIFILASSHHVAFDGASIYEKGNYITPLGEVKVNLSLARTLIAENKEFVFRPDAHRHEHSLEVQLPFLQYKLGENIQIIPVIIGTQNYKTCKKLADILKPYFNQKNLFVISTDFSHFPDYEDAIAVDRVTAEAILTNDPDALINTLKTNSNKNIDNLATSLCGWSSVATLMYMTEDDPEIKYNEVIYMNSGDSKTYGDKYRVVGYYGIAVTGTGQENDEYGLRFSDAEKMELLHIARSTINEYIKNGRTPDIEVADLTDNLQLDCGAFVTLHKDGKLRGCIGRFDARDPLYLVVQQMAISASTKDYRFPRVPEEEIDELEIEISVLSPMRKISSIDEIEMGRHGIYIKKGMSSGTFLPQVAVETGWSKEEFLGHCAKDKARIGWDGWKDADIYIYEAYIFSEKDFEE